MERREARYALNGLNFRVVEWGPIEGRPIVMLHGIRGYAETFESIAEALQPGTRVIAYDQRGRGDTDWDPRHDYYTDTYVADLQALIGALELQRFDLLGHSMGGIAAIVYAALHSDDVRRLVIEDAGPGAFEHSDGAHRIRKELASAPIHFGSWDEASAYMRELRPTVTEEARQQRLQKMLKSADSGGFTWRHDHAGIAAVRLNPDPQRVIDLVPYVARIECATLVLRGGRSDYLKSHMSDRMAELNPRITVTEIPDAGHYIHDDQPVLFANAVKAFLGAADVQE